MRKTHDSAVNPAWFPWPNKVVSTLLYTFYLAECSCKLQVCVLNILWNLPRFLLSNTQMEIITWGMMNLGIDNLPSISSLKDTFGRLQQRYGIRTTCRKGALGHVYYTNSLADQMCQVGQALVSFLCLTHSLRIWQEFSNPCVISHLCADEHAPTLGTEGGIQKALGRGQPALDKYQRCWLVPNMVGPYPTNYKPPKDVWQHLGQFTHISRTYYDYTGGLW